MSARYLINEYHFGSIKVNNIEYNSDLIITPAKVIGDWWRKEGHLLTLEDLPELDWSRLRTVFIGTGASGLMKVDPGLIVHLEKNRVIYLIKKTPIAVREYNRSIHNMKVGIFHLTC